MSTKSNSIICPICQSAENHTLKHQKNGHSIYQCQECTVFFVNPFPRTQDIVQIYDESYYQRGSKYQQESKNDAHDFSTSNELEKLELVHQFKSSGNLVDIGCATGGFLKAAQSSGFNVIGTEISEYAANEARKKTNATVYHDESDLSNLDQNSIDIITLWDVIEHLENPHSILKISNHLLNPNGHLIFSTGDIGSTFAKLTGRFWPLLTPPQHLFYHTQKSIETLLQQHHFEIVSFRYYSRTVPCDLVLLKAREAIGKIVYPLQALSTALNLNTKKLRLNLHDIMTVVAKPVHPHEKRSS